jgi:hypothetical protein
MSRHLCVEPKQTAARLRAVQKNSKASQTENQKPDSKTTREHAMARTALTDLPKHNPCAQCGQPIALPEWVEETRGRVAYLWHCHACDYRFEAVAFFDEEQNSEALAA